MLTHPTLDQLTALRLTGISTIADDLEQRGILKNGQGQEDRQDHQG